jgi:hypothetical protein
MHSLLLEPIPNARMKKNASSTRRLQLCFHFYMIEAKPENLVGDRACESDPLDEELRRNGIEMTAPTATKLPTQDRRRLSRCVRRWLVERFSAESSSAGSTTP